MKYRSLPDMDGLFQMVSYRSKCWPGIISQALIVAKKWIFRNAKRAWQAAHNTPLLVPWSENKIHVRAVNETQMFGKKIIKGA